MSDKIKFLITAVALVAVAVVWSAVSQSNSKPDWCNRAPACHQQSYDMGYNSGVAREFFSRGQTDISRICITALANERAFEGNPYLEPPAWLDDKSYLEGCHAALRG